MSARPGAVRAAAVLAVLAVLAPAAGCSQLPVEGPIVETSTTPDLDRVQPLGIDPVPPQQNASRVDIVNGFLDAMTAWPQRLDVAKQFLSSDAKTAWEPDRSTITYADLGTVGERGASVDVQLVEPELLDDRGAWQGPLAPDERTLQLRLVQENGQYRISDPPDSQLVPSDWFAARYQQANVYFFDNTSRILVPEPVFVPSGDQAATTLVARLLSGPADPRVETTAFPPGIEVDLSTPVSADGVADVRLVNGQPPTSPDVVEKMLAQLAWTLRQEDVTALRLTISGQEIRLPGGVSQFRVTGAPVYAPTGYQANLALHGLRDGLLVSGTRDELTPVPGPFGSGPAGLRSVTVAVDGGTAAGISADGRRVLLAPVRAPSPEVPSTIEVALRGASDLLPPAWDFTDRLWVVDRTPLGAVVRYVEGGQARVLRVPHVSGRQVIAFLVSRDATRVVFVVRTRRPGLPGTVDELRVGRIEVPENSGRLRALDTERIELGGADPAQIKDIAWTSTTTVAALSTVTRDELYSVQTVAVDGAPTDTSPTSISGDVVGLAGTPVPDSLQFAVTPSFLIDIVGGTRRFLDDSPTTSLGYAG